MALFATSAWADAAYGFENNATSESGYPTSAGDGSRSISSSISRTGSYSLEQNNNNTSDKVVRLQNVSATFKGGKHYVHSIAYIRKNTSNNATLKGYSFYAGSEFGNQTASTALSSDWTRVVNKAQKTGNTQDYTSVELRYKTNTANSGDKVYLDDIIVYVTESNDKTDLKKPGSATEPEATAVEISWTNGEDQSDSNNGATGIQNTLIWKRTSGSENDLTLNDQGVYSLTAKEGPSTDQSGHWTLVTASVAAGTAGETSSYSGTFTPNDVYAIVHRDLAYNYSTPTYVTIPAATVPTIATFTVAGVVATIDQQNKTITATVPYATAGWPNLTPSVTLGGTATSYTPTTAQDFSTSVTYTASDDAETPNSVDYTVTITRTAASTDATLKSLKVNGADIDGFDAATLSYNYEIAYTAGLPVVTAEANDTKAKSVEVTNVKSVPNDATVLVTAEDGTTIKTYTISFTRAEANNDATLSALSVAGCTLSPAFASGTETYTTTLPFYASMPVVGDVTATKNDENAEDPEVSISGNVITIQCVAEDGTTEKDYTVTVSFDDVPTASSSINIEQNVLDNSKSWGYATALTAAHITIADANALDSLNDDPSKPNRNYGFLGLKFKKVTSTVTVIVPAGQQLNVKWGNISTAIKVKVNGVSQTNIATKTDGFSTTWHLDAPESTTEVVFSVAEDNKTITLQQVKIGAGCDAITLPAIVTYNEGAGTCATKSAKFTSTALILPEATAPSGYNFDGWYDAETSGKLVGKAGAEYTPTANITLYAYYSEATGINDVENEIKAVKFFENGQLFIEKNGKIYNAMGQEIR